MVYSDNDHANIGKGVAVLARNSPLARLRSFPSFNPDLKRAKDRGTEVEVASKQALHHHPACASSRVGALTPVASLQQPAPNDHLRCASR